jgi:nucleoside phosphorylase
VPARVLILAAFHPELDPLRTALGDSLVGSVAGLSVTARVAGIGLAAAAAGAAVHIAELRPDAVVLIGSCGAYASAGLAIGDVVVGRRLHLVDLSSLAGHAEFPEPIAVVLDADAALTEGLSADGTRTCSVATTLAITVDDSIASRISNQVDVQIEHLEAHGVATACSSLRVAFAMTLGVANMVGARGRGEWRAHHSIAEAAAATRVMRWLESGAPGAFSLAPSRL